MDTIKIEIPCLGGRETVEVGFLKIDCASEKTLKACASLYCRIWRESPWNEFFWKENEVLEDIRQESNRLCAEGLLATYVRAPYKYELEASEVPPEELMVIGFTWGYTVSQQELQDIAGNRKLDFLFANGQRVFYVDELGVSSKYRKRGIGKRLSSLLLKAARKHATIAILRTDEQAIAAQTLYQALKFKNSGVRDKHHPERSYWILPLDH